MILRKAIDLCAQQGRKNITWIWCPQTLLYSKIYGLRSFSSSGYAFKQQWKLPEFRQAKKERKDTEETPIDFESLSIEEKFKYLVENKKKVPENWRKDMSLPEWKRQKYALMEKFEYEKWNPKKKLSRSQMEAVRIMHRNNPKLTTKEIGSLFRVSPEVIRRILKSKWKPTEEEAEKLDEKWLKRKEKVKYELKTRSKKETLLAKVQQDGFQLGGLAMNEFPKDVEDKPEKIVIGKEETKKKRPKIQIDKKLSALAKDTSGDILRTERKRRSKPITVPDLSNSDF